MLSFLRTKVELAIVSAHVHFAEKSTKTFIQSPRVDPVGIAAVGIGDQITNLLVICC